MKSDWRDCIVTYVDLTGVKRRAAADRSATGLMRRLHSVAATEVPRLTAVAHAYVWNDSVLLLSFVDQHCASFVAAMRDADGFKRKLDAVAKSYAVAVKGQTFPTQLLPKPSLGHVTILGASSWAMANCFEIEKRLGKIRAGWYVDGRIARKLRGTNQARKHQVALFPSGRSRAVHSYKGYLWGTAV